MSLHRYKLLENNFSLLHELNEVLPDKVIISPAKNAYKTKMDDLVVTSKNALNIFDRGYVNYENFMERLVSLKISCRVWNGGKVGDYINDLSIII